MLGAIVGDIVGSVYEWHNIKTKDFPLFRDDCFFTDDTVMTIATAEALMNGGGSCDFVDAYKSGDGFIRMPGTADNSVIGYILMSTNLTIPGAMVQQ